MSLFIVASGQYCQSVGDEQPDLKQLVTESVGRSVRRIDRFIQLALIGAGRASAGLPSNSGVYYASGCGDVQITVELLTCIYRRKQAPKPLSFVNSVSNAASFYVSSCLGLEGPSNFVTSRYFAAESAIHIAALEMELGKVESALVGAVDIVLPPLQEHYERLGLQEGVAVAEASHWLQIRKAPGDQPVMALLDSLQWYSDADTLLAGLQSLAGERGAVSFNQFIDEEIKAQCLSACELEELDYASPYGHYESQSGELIHHFVQHGSGKWWLVSGDPHGRYQLLAFSKPEQ